MIIVNYNINLRKFREENGLTQEETAEIMGITRTVYTKYENGYEIIPIRHLLTFCNHFNILIDQVFGLPVYEYSSLNRTIDAKLIGQRLKMWRKENNLTQDKLAKILNTTDTVICGYEAGRRLFATPFLYQICHKYHVSADYLLGRIDKDPQK